MSCFPFSENPLNFISYLFSCKSPRNIRIDRKHKTNRFTHVPNELLVIIQSSLGFSDLCTLRLVSKRWRIVVDTNGFHLHIEFLKLLSRKINVDVTSLPMKFTYLVKISNCSNNPSYIILRKDQHHSDPLKFSKNQLYDFTIQASLNCEVIYQPVIKPSTFHNLESYYPLQMSSYLFTSSILIKNHPDASPEALKVRKVTQAIVEDYFKFKVKNTKK